jgi:nucleoside-diphosphate-sugar epimerase
LAVNDLCRMAYYDKYIRLLSDGSPQRDFIHGSDVCRAVDTVLNRASKDALRNTYHISSSKTSTLLELAGMVQEVYFEMYDVRLEVSTPQEKAVNDFDRYSEVARYTLDNTALRNLGFECQVDLKAGIRQLFTYFDSRAHA